MLTHTPVDQVRKRTLVGLLALSVVALLASVLPTTDNWPLAVGFGGVIGDALASLTAGNLGILIGDAPAHALIGVMALGLAL